MEVELNEEMSVELLSYEKISDVFAENITDDSIHIIVKRPGKSILDLV